VYCGADYGTAAATLARAKKVDNFELVLYTKTGMVMVNIITHGYKNFLIL
jgi:hypothetical protein